MKIKTTEGDNQDHDNAPIHTALVAEAEEANNGFELLLHASYTPNIVLSDSFLFPKINVPPTPCGHHFGNNDEVIIAVKKFLEDKDATFFRDRTTMQEYR